jgi:3-methyl-2-oxobutanoate hydroxymethyltransferase
MKTTMRLTVSEIIDKKKRGEKITVLTAYDFAFAPIVDAAGVDIILVGDSMANVILGMDSTADITLDEMINHSRAVVKGSERALVVGDMPYCAYQADPRRAVASAKRFVDEAGCQAVKLEWFDQALDVTAEIVRQNIPVMGHVGFTPQTPDATSKSKVRGKDVESAKRLIQQANALEAEGCFSIVLECVPWQLAKIISERLAIPTIGIGAGAFCDGQVLVLNDILGLFKKFTPKFVKQYADVYAASLSGIEQYVREVKEGFFPTEKESFTLSPEVLEEIEGSE